MDEIVLVLEDDAERAPKGVGPACALLVEECRGLCPFDRFRDSRKLGERFAAQSPDRGDDRARRALADTGSAHHDDAHLALGVG